MRRRSKRPGNLYTSIHSVQRSKKVRSLSGGIWVKVTFLFAYCVRVSSCVCVCVCERLSGSVKRSDHFLTFFFFFFYNFCNANEKTDGERLDYLYLFKLRQLWYRSHPKTFTRRFIRDGAAACKQREREVQYGRQDLQLIKLKLRYFTVSRQWYNLLLSDVKV